MYFVPEWLKNYQRVNLQVDVTAGLLVSVLVIPQSLAYALLAGLPAQAGLYASIFPVIVYAFFGSSMRQAVGPVAITAIMTASVLGPLAPQGSGAYIALAAALCFFSGLLTLLFGLLRIGFLSQLLSRPVISGFITGSALLIIQSQLRLLLGNGGDRPVTLSMSLLACAALLFNRFALERLIVRFGGSLDLGRALVRVMPLLVLATGTLVVVGLGLDGANGVDVVGSVGGSVGSGVGFGGGALAAPNIHFSTLQQLSGPALVLAFVGSVQNITMAQALAVQRNERVDVNREMVGLGLANMAASVFGGMPVGGGLSRSAVNVAAGAVTPLASVITALSTLVLVLVGLDWMARVPLAVLASVIVVAAISMVDIRTFRESWNYDRADALALTGTALGVFLAGIQSGLALGVGFSLVTLLLRASTPHIAVLGRIEGTEHFRNVERHGVQTLPNGLFLRVDESLFFGNMNAVESRLTMELEQHREVTDVVLIMSAVNRIDTTAMQILTDVNREMLLRGMRLHLAEVKGPVQDRLLRSPLWTELSGDIYQSVNAAFEAIAGRLPAQEFHI